MLRAQLLGRRKGSLGIRLVYVWRGWENGLLGGDLREIDGGTVAAASQEHVGRCDFD